MSSVLPTWLPEDFVKTLNLTFGARLRAQLVEIIGKVNSGKAYKDGFRRAPSYVTLICIDWWHQPMQVNASRALRSFSLLAPAVCAVSRCVFIVLVLEFSVFI